MAHTLTDVCRRVEEVFARSGSRGWPNPHPDLMMPADEEYSRVTDPGRHRIGIARVSAWAEVLAEVPGIEVRRLRPEERPPLTMPVDGWVVTCDRIGTVPMLLVTYDADDATLVREEATPGVMICAGTVDVVIDEQRCGCDACDEGSDALIEGLDATIIDLVTGPVVALRHERFEATMSAGSTGSSATGRTPLVPLGELHDWCRRLLHGESLRLPEGTTVVVGAPWGVLGVG